jgi:hypothetical protein
MIEALLYMFAPDDGAPRKLGLPAECPANAPAITETVSRPGGRMDISVSGSIKFHCFNDTVFFECRPQFITGPFSTLSGNS